LSFMVYLLYIVIPPWCIVIPPWCIVIYGIFQFVCSKFNVCFISVELDYFQMFRAKVILDEFIIVSRFL
jgi:sterol desaturase/sphingolipid hydroxylase (fatty acid hydroxylase superfamily)